MRRLRLLSSIALLALPWTGCSDDDPVGADGDGDTSGGINPGNMTTGEPEVTSTDESGTDTGSGGGGQDDETGDGSCMDDVHNSNETDVDCGGPDCPACNPGQNCEEDSDCTTGVCQNGECQEPTCYDDVQNGNESGVDCGGGCPNSCLPGPGPCLEDIDCDDGEFCMDGECTPSDCRNGIQDSSETDVDCGGVDCPNCPDGSGCVLEEDCDSGICEMGMCIPPTCMDGVTNGNETDNDCGGDTCPACPNGADCDSGADCVSGACDTGTCVAGSCNDMIQNGLETDVDCGGPICGPCMPDAECMEDDDCDSGVCDEAMGVCLMPACDDNVENGDETDIDCGNSCGANTCEVGEGCDDDTDCVEMVCELTVCSAPDCFDGVQNGIETGVDCGDNVGPGCPLCDGGEGCISDADCVSGVCDEMAGTCQDPTCMDGVQNQDETDEDCGNSCGATCVVGEICDDNADCVTGSCSIGLCVAAACDDGIFNGDEVDIDCGGSCPQPCTIGVEVTVNTTTMDFQTSPSIAVAPDGSYWVVAWTSSPFAGAAQDGSGSGIYAQMFTAAGPMGGEFQVNSSTMGNQRFSDVAAYNDGFVIVWQTDGGQDGDGLGVFGQLYDDTGGTIGGEFQLSQTTAGPQRRPTVAMDSAGNFVTCWDSQAAEYDVFCRRYSAVGTPLAGEAQVNVTDTGDEQLPSVGRDTLGNYTVAWQSSNGSDGDQIGVFMRRFNGAGTQVTAETQVNTVTAGNQSEPAVAVDGSGEFLIVWTSQNLDGSGTGIGARLYDNTGAAAGGQFTVNTTTAGNQQRPAAAFATDGDFWVAWQTPFDGDTTGVFGQQYTAAGATVGQEFIVNPETDERQEDPDVGIRLNTELIGVWSWGDAALTTSDIRQVRYDGAL